MASPRLLAMGSPLEARILLLAAAGGALARHPGRSGWARPGRGGPLRSGLRSRAGRRGWRSRRPHSGRRALGVRPRRQAEQLAQLVALHDLDFEQAARDSLQLVAPLGQDAPGRLVRFGQDPRNLGVDLPRRLLAVEPALRRQRDVEESRALVAVVVNRTERLAHPE